LNQEDRNDTELILGWLEGRESSLEELFERYRRPFYAYLNRMLNGDRMSADDLFQELWLRIVRKLPESKHLDNFVAWAFKIAHNLVMEHFRSRTRRRKIGENTPDGELPETTAAQEETWAALDESVRIAQLDAALRIMAPEQLEVFELRRKGVSFKDIAKIQRCPLNTALGRMHKAVGFLRKYLAGGAND